MNSSVKLCSGLAVWLIVVPAYADERTVFKKPDGTITGYAQIHGDRTRVYKPDGTLVEIDRYRSDGNTVRQTPDGRTLGIIERRR